MGVKYLRPYRRKGRLVHNLLIRHAGRLLPLIGRGWFGASYPGRWDWPASRYLDVRIAGKATNSADITLVQAAARDAEETIDCLTTNPNPPKQETFAHWRRVEFARYDEHVREYYNRHRLHLVHGGLGRGFSQDLNADSANERIELIETECEWHPVLAFFWLWLLAAVKPEAAPLEIHSSNIYWQGKRVHQRRGSLVSLNEVIGINDPDVIKDSKRRDANPPSPVRTVLLEPRGRTRTRPTWQGWRHRSPQQSDSRPSSAG
jgi:hypothetical protein